jgi:hypothetical protein
MKVLVGNYVFNKTSKTVVFSDFAAVVLERLLVITNVTRNTMIYLFTDPTLGGTVTGNTLTLTFDTSAMANTDKLQIFYETADTPALDTTAQTVNVSVQALTDMVGLLKRIAQYTESLEVTDSAQRLRVDVDTFGASLLNNTFLGVAIQQGRFLHWRNTAFRKYQRSGTHLAGAGCLEKRGGGTVILRRWYSKKLNVLITYGSHKST